MKKLFLVPLLFLSACKAREREVCLKGVLYYHTGSSARGSKILLVDRNGKPIPCEVSS